MSSPSNYIAPKWIDQLKPGDKVLCRYPDKYLQSKNLKEMTIERVIWRHRCQSGVAVILRELGDEPLDIAWIRQKE